LLVTLEPRYRVFGRNLRDLVLPRRQPPLRLISWPAAPWPDVIVSTRLPWGGFFQSLCLHALALVTLWGVAQILPRRMLVAQQPVFHHEDVIYYSPSEYLPPLDTGKVPHAIAEKGDPEFAPQPIISVPPEADNRRQTVVTPPPAKLDHEVPLPNIVAWSPAPVAVPIAVTAREAADLRLPSLNSQAVAPQPDVRPATQRQAPAMKETAVAPAPRVDWSSQREVVRAPEPSIVAPPPQIESAISGRLGDINIGRAEAVAPAPKLPLGEQQALMAQRTGAPSIGGPSVVPPPPSVQGAGVAGSGGGKIIALNVRPQAPATAVDIPAGNRSGTFAATPEGRRGAAGTPGSKNGAAISRGDGLGTNNAEGQGNTSGNAPPGLYVGAGPEVGVTTPSGESPADLTLRASTSAPWVTVTPKNPSSEVPTDKVTDLDRRVFGSKKFYSMTLNMPNLNSAGGSWVIRFAELNESQEQGPLSAPVATEKVDPAYPLELMRRNIQGTVTLYAVINRDGSVGAVRVLDGVNDRLDGYAEAALRRWHFQPASKNGIAVAIEAVVRIPFKPFPKNSMF
jgi:TonB family protein